MSAGKTTSRFGKLTDLIGKEAALRIREEFGGLVLSVPKVDGAERKKRDDTIKADYDKGRKAAELARAHKLTIRQIYNILGKTP